MPIFLLSRWGFRVVLALVLVSLGAGAAAWWMWPRPAPLPQTPALVTQVREVARLSALELTVYKKLHFKPEPQASGSTWGDLATWLRFALNAPEGRAIVFARVHLTVDLAALDERALAVTGDEVVVKLPPVQATVELLPAETEVIGSNLDSRQTAELFDLAKAAFEREALADPALLERARRSARQSIELLLRGRGFRAVRFSEGGRG